MAITDEFKEAVQSRDNMMVRIMLKDILLIDPTCAQFEEMENYALSVLPDLYVPHDGERLNYDVTAWNKDYLNQQMVRVVNSFSSERIDLLKGMVRYLYREQANQIKNEREFIPTNHAVSRKQVGIGVTATGAAIAVAGVVTSHTLIAVGGMAVAAAGIILIATDKEGK